MVGYIRSAKLNDPQLDEWEAEIRAHAAERGYNLVEVVRDEGVSGVAVWKPGLERVIRDVECGKYTGIILLGLKHLALASAPVTTVVERVKRAGGWMDPIGPNESVRS